MGLFDFLKQSMNSDAIRRENKMANEDVRRKIEYAERFASIGLFDESQFQRVEDCIAQAKDSLKDLNGEFVLEENLSERYALLQTMCEDLRKQKIKQKEREKAKVKERIKKLQEERVGIEEERLSKRRQKEHEQNLYQQHLDYLKTLPEEQRIYDYEGIVLEAKRVSQKENDINQIDNMDGHDFEAFCAKLLKKNGYVDVMVTRGSGDQGIDIIAYKDGVKYGLQCKCYSSPVGNRAVQEVFSGISFYRCNVGIVLTNSYFTRSAIELAKRNGVILWDREKLLKML